MDSETSILLVKYKLMNLQSRKQILGKVSESIQELEKMENLLKDKAGNLRALNPKLLEKFYFAEDIIDLFLVQPSSRNFKVPYMHLKSVYIQTRFMSRMEEFFSLLKKEASNLQLQQQEESRESSNPQVQENKESSEPEIKESNLDGQESREPEIKESSDKKVEPLEDEESSNLQVQPSESQELSEVQDQVEPIMNGIDGNIEAENENPEPTLEGYSHDDKRSRILDLAGREVKGLAELILNGNPSPFQISVVDAKTSVETTELRKIYDDVKVESHFECRAWACIGQEFNKSKLLADILKQVVKSIIPRTKVEVLDYLPLVDQLLRNFLMEKRYLIILTDIRRPDIPEILKDAFPNSLNGSRVIFSYPATYQDDQNDGVGNATGGTEDEVVEEDIDEQRLRGAFDGETEIVGLRDKVLELAELIFNRASDRSFLLSVVGKSGSGKTKLVKTIYDNPLTRQKFICRAWVSVYVSGDFDKRNVLIEILKQVTGDFKDEEGLGLDELINKLKVSLARPRYLIVLDDFHQRDAWYDLRKILPARSSTSSRVILITRHISVAQGLTSKNVRLRRLNRDESWELFLKKVMKENEKDNQELKDLKEKIWQKCQGLPLAICVLGGLLSARNLNYSGWSSVIEQIMPDEKNKKLAGQDDGTVTEVPSEQLGPSLIWALGYRDLSPRLRICLHYLCLFPKSYEIPVRTLFHLWLAEQFVKPVEEEGNMPEDQVKKDFEELALRNMIEVKKRRPDGSAKTCLVPGTLHDTFLNAEDLGSLHIHGKSGYSSKCIRRLAEHIDIQINTPSDKDIEHLHSYVSFKTRKGDKPAEEVGKFLDKTIIKRGIGFLRVLDLEHVYKPVLPETLGKLQLLRYIGLRWTFLDSIPMSIGDLPGLEALDLKHTNITTLPMSIWRMRTLKHLYMNDILFEISIQKPFASGSLAKLQTLWGLFIGNRCPPIDWLKSLNHLRKLGLTCHSASLEIITKWIHELTSLQSLRLRSVTDYFEPSDLNLGSMQKYQMLTELYLLGKISTETDISQLPQSLKILTLSASQLSDDPMPKLGELKNLNTLRLFTHSYLGEQMKCLQSGFPCLHVLKLWVLTALKEWTIEDGAMPALKELEIRYCQNLETPHGLTNVGTLTELILTNMKGDFVDELEKSMGKNTVITKNNWKIEPPWD